MYKTKLSKITLLAVITVISVFSRLNAGDWGISFYQDYLPDVSHTGFTAGKTFRDSIASRLLQKQTSSSEDSDWDGFNENTLLQRLGADHAGLHAYLAKPSGYSASILFPPVILTIQLPGILNFNGSGDSDSDSSQEEDTESSPSATIKQASDSTHSTSTEPEFVNRYYGIPFPELTLEQITQTHEPTKPNQASNQITDAASREMASRLRTEPDLEGNNFRIYFINPVTQIPHPPLAVKFFQKPTSVQAEGELKAHIESEKKALDMMRGHNNIVFAFGEIVIKDLPAFVFPEYQANLYELLAILHVKNYRTILTPFEISRVSRITSFRAEINSEQIYLSLAKDLIEGLKALHLADLIHQNLNMFNIFIEQLPNNRFRLVIGGLGSTIDDATALEDLACFPLYRPPEYYSHLPPYVAQVATARWQLGILLASIGSGNFFIKLITEYKKNIRQEIIAKHHAINLRQYMRDDMSRDVQSLTRQIKSLPQVYEKLDPSILSQQDIIQLMGWYLLSENPADRPDEFQLLDLIADYFRPQ